MLGSHLVLGAEEFRFLMLGFDSCIPQRDLWRDYYPCFVPRWSPGVALLNRYLSIPVALGSLV